MRHFLYTTVIVLAFISAGGTDSEAQTMTKAQEIHSKIQDMAKGKTFANAHLSVCATDLNGNILVALDKDKMQIPASNMKLISSGAALHLLGGDFRYETSIGYDGVIEDGILKGNLYIIGGGDPTIGSKDTTASPLSHTFGQWEKMIKNAGIRRIEGCLIGDGRWADGMAEEPTWLWNDIGTYYGTGVTGLMFYENMISFMVTPGKEPGAPVDIKQHYPTTPWMTFRYDCSTGDRKTGDRLYMYTSELAPVAEIRGTFGIDKAAKRVDFSNKFPEYTCARYFLEWLQDRGIACGGGAADFRLERDRMRDACRNGGITVIGTTSSPELRKIAHVTNHASNNLYAETMLRTLGKTLHDSASYDSSYVAMNDVLKMLGADPSKGGIRLQDGSGLSRQNLISADFFCRFLRSMSQSAAFSDFLSSLPSPGDDGTLYYNMSRYPLSLKSRILAKSGSMNGIRCYSGYIMPSGQNIADSSVGIIVFSVMANNCTAPDWEIRPALDRIMALLTELN